MADYTMTQLIAALRQAGFRDVTRRKIRYFVQRGMLPKPNGERGGARYDENHLRRVLEIQEIRRRRKTEDKMLRMGKLIVDPMMSADNQQIYQLAENVRAAFALTTEAFDQYNKAVFGRLLKLETGILTVSPPAAPHRNAPVKPVLLYEGNHASKHEYECPKCGRHIRGASPAHAHVRHCRKRTRITPEEGRS